MRKVFVDLHLRPNLEQIDDSKYLIERANALGYNVIGISLPIGGGEETIKTLRREFPHIDLVARVNLSPKNTRELLKLLNKTRWRFEVIAVECTTKEVTMQAAKDWRVDLLTLTSYDPTEHFFGISEAKLASEKNAALEINMSILLYSKGQIRINLFKVLRRSILTAKKYDVPIVISSGASKPSMIRRPEDYAFLAYLIDLDLHNAKKALSENPRAIVERNRRKLSGNYVCPGVYIVRRGENC
ncbi:MAG: RNase P subunit p30 family protein [Candidatus Bathyarchaeia archaeon]